MNAILVFWLPVAVLVVQLGCAISRPCGEAGDISWSRQFDGDKTCRQVKDDTGKWVNHGEFVYFYKNGRIGLQGKFYKGKKDGIWSEFDEKGEKKLEKYFDHGVEKAFALPTSETSKK